jgi:hypothetical protein
MKAKPLPSRKVLSQMFLYDGKNLIWKNPPKNHSCLTGKPAGSPHAKGYLTVGIFGSLYLVHRVIFKMKIGREPPQIDHRNRTKNDNTWANLLPSTNARNARNRANTRYANLPRGVGLIPSGRYRAIGCDGGKLVHLGVFANKAKAAKAVRSFVEQKQW